VPTHKKYPPRLKSFAFKRKVFFCKFHNAYFICSASTLCLPKLWRPFPLFVFQSQSVCLSFQFLASKFPMLLRRAHLQTRTTKDLETWQRYRRHLSSSNACVRLCLLCPHSTASKEFRSALIQQGSNLRTRRENRENKY